MTSNKFKTTFKRGDLVSYPFGVGVILEKGINRSTGVPGAKVVYKVLWKDGIASWKPGVILKLK